MTAMLVPPVAIVRELGWRQVMGFAHGHDPFWAQVRGQQLALLNRNVPFNVAALAVNVILLMAAFAGDVSLVPAVPWLGGIAVMGAGWLLRRVLEGRRPPDDPPVATIGKFWLITFELVSLALFWAGMSGALMPVLPATGQGVLMFEGLVFLCAASICATTMPIAMLLTSVIVGAGMVVAMPVGAPLDQPMIALGIATIIAMLLRSSLMATYMLMSRLKRETEFREQEEVVRLLLNEYEAHASDWLLELDARGCLTHVTQRLADVSGRRRDALLGQPFLALIDPIEGAPAPKRWTRRSANASRFAIWWWLCRWAATCGGGRFRARPNRMRRGALPGFAAWAAT